jgi:alpha-aminoadipate carrier protein LysW
MNCLECDGQISIPKDALAGEIVTCPDCGASFEVYKGESADLQIRPAQVEGEDWGE